MWDFEHHPIGRGKNGHLLSEEAGKKICWHSIPESSDPTSQDSTSVDRSLYTRVPYLTVYNIRTRQNTSLYIGETVRLLLFLFFFAQHRLCTDFFQNVMHFFFKLLNCKDRMIFGKLVTKE